MWFLKSRHVKWFKAHKYDMNFSFWLPIILINLINLNTNNQQTKDSPYVLVTYERLTLCPEETSGTHHTKDVKGPKQLSVPLTT